ncbi:MAG: hypothetical protein ACRESR_01695 [Gammaproteobacteria bacterium]
MAEEDKADPGKEAAEKDERKDRDEEIAPEERVRKNPEKVRKVHHEKTPELERPVRAHEPRRKQPKDSASMQGLPGFGGKEPGD